MRYPKGYVSKFDAKKYRLERRQRRIDLGICTKCDNPAVKGKTDCFKCLEEMKNRNRRSREDRQKAGECIQCGKASILGILRCEDCKNRLNGLNRERQSYIKTETLTHYGKQGKLQCCWDGCEISDIDMLTLDHIENDGAKHRKEYTKSGRGGGAFLYNSLIRLGFPEGFQTLCANHNLKKHIMTLKGESQ